LRDTRIKNNTAVSLAGADLVTFIREERERELFLEGQRWFDLRRYMVDTKYPYTTTIEHSFTYYKYVNYVNAPDHSDYYRLEKNDASYTLNIPKEVRDFQLSIGSNERSERPCNQYRFISIIKFCDDEKILYLSYSIGWRVEHFQFLHQR
jgi:hypothetical protein